MRAADGYAVIPETGEIRDGDAIAVIGAGGPMGQMHVIRNICSGKKGVVGGSTSSSKLIEVQSAGSQAFTKTKLKIVLKRETRDRIEKNKEDVENHKANRVKINGMFTHHEKLKKIKKELSPAESMQFRKISEIKKQLEEETVTLENTKKELAKEYSLFENAYVKIKREIFPGVIIEIGSSKYSVKEEMSNTIFKIKDGEVSAFRPTT